MRMTNEEIIKKLSNVGNGFVFDKEMFYEFGSMFWRRTYEDVLDAKYTVDIALSIINCNGSIYIEHTVRGKESIIDRVRMYCKLADGTLDFGTERDVYTTVALLDMDIIRGWFNKLTKDYVSQATDKLIDSRNTYLDLGECK